MKRILYTGLLLLSLATFNSCSTDELSDYEKIENYEIQKGIEQGIYPLPNDFNLQSINYDYNIKMKTIYFNKDGIEYKFSLSTYYPIIINKNTKVVFYENYIVLENIDYDSPPGMISGNRILFEFGNKTEYPGYNSNRVIMKTNKGYVISFKQY